MTLGLRIVGALEGVRGCVTAFQDQIDRDVTARIAAFGRCAAEPLRSIEGMGETERAIDGPPRHAARLREARGARREARATTAALHPVPRSLRAAAAEAPSAGDAPPSFEPDAAERAFFDAIRAACAMAGERETHDRVLAPSLGAPPPPGDGPPALDFS